VKIYYDVVQMSDAWWELKRGVPTASNFDKVITPAEGRPSASQMDFICQLIAERMLLTSNFSHLGPTRPMINGILTEPEARKYYEMETGNVVHEAGFVSTEDGRFGFSPDGLVMTGDGPHGEKILGDCGGLELKCPEPKTHIRYLIDARLPDDYKAQVHGPLALALIDDSMPFRWWDFMSYFPGLPPFLIRVKPDEYTQKLAHELEHFWHKYEKYLEQFKS